MQKVEDAPPRKRLILQHIRALMLIALPSWPAAGRWLYYARLRSRRKGLAAKEGARERGKRGRGREKERDRKRGRRREIGRGEGER